MTTRATVHSLAVNHFSSAKAVLARKRISDVNEMLQRSAASRAVHNVGRTKSCYRNDKTPSRDVSICISVSCMFWMKKLLSDDGSVLHSLMGGENRLEWSRIVSNWWKFWYSGITTGVFCSSLWTSWGKKVSLSGDEWTRQQRRPNSIDERSSRTPRSLRLFKYCWRIQFWDQHNVACCLLIATRVRSTAN